MIQSPGLARCSPSSVGMTSGMPGMVAHAFADSSDTPTAHTSISARFSPVNCLASTTTGFFLNFMLFLSQEQREPKPPPPVKALLEFPLNESDDGPGVLAVGELLP